MGRLVDVSRGTSPLASTAPRGCLSAPYPTSCAASARTHGISPHAHVISRRIELARRLLIGGGRAADAAHTLGFHDQRTSPAASATTPPPARYTADHS